MTEKLFTYEEFQSLIDSSYDGIHITDDKGVTRFYNRACEEIEGISKEDIIGRSVQEFVDSGVYPESITLEAIRQKKRVNMFQHINGCNRQVELNTLSQIRFNSSSKLRL
ncbi:PAS domain S-box protein, partial [Salinicoccus siamensis]